MKFTYLLFMGLLTFLFGTCEKPDFSKLVYESYNGSLAPEYRERYIIEVLKDKIIYTNYLPNDENLKLEEANKEEVDIDSTDFAKIKQEVYKLAVIKCKSSEDCDGGGVQTITGYKNEKEVFSNEHYGCGNKCDGFYKLKKYLQNFKTNK